MNAKRTNHCEECGREFKAKTSRKLRCPTCQALREVISMRNHSGDCAAGCGARFYRRNGHDKFCVECHLLGFGDPRWHPGPPLEEPCVVCAHPGPSVAPDLRVCASCVGCADDREVWAAVNAELRRAKLGQLRDEATAPSQRPQEPAGGHPSPKATVDPPEVPDDLPPLPAPPSPEDLEAKRRADLTAQLDRLDQLIAAGEMSEQAAAPRRRLYEHLLRGEPVNFADSDPH